MCPLRLHLAQLLLEADRSDEAAVALQHAPGDAQARDLMARAMGAPTPSAPQPPRKRAGFDWKAAEEQVGDAVPPRFTETPVRADGQDDSEGADAWDVEDPGTVRLADVGLLGVVVKSEALTGAVGLWAKHQEGLPSPQQLSCGG